MKIGNKYIKMSSIFIFLIIIIFLFLGLGYSYVNSYVSVSSSVSIKKYVDKLILSKEKLRNYVNIKQPTKLIFLDTGVSDPTDSKYIDVSEQGGGLILAWMDGETIYISAKEANFYVKVPVDSENLFGVVFSNIKFLDVTKLDVSNVKNMGYMFSIAGVAVKNFQIVGLDTWNTNKVTNMSGMFDSAGTNADYKLDLSKWNVDKITSSEGFNYGVESKVIPPIW